MIRVGNGISYRKKFRGIDSERFPLFRGRKCSFRGIPSSAEEPIPKLRTEQNGTESREKIKFYGTRTASMITLTSNWRPHPCKGCVITTTLRKQAKYRSKIISPYLKSRLFWHYFLNFGLPRFVLSRFLFRGMVRNGIPTVCFYICSTERNSELFSLPLKGSEGNSESMLMFLFPWNGIPSCFLFRGRVRNGIQRFFVPGNSQNSVGIPICPVNSQPYLWCRIFNCLLFL